MASLYCNCSGTCSCGQITGGNTTTGIYTIPSTGYGITGIGGSTGSGWTSGYAATTQIKPKTTYYTFKLPLKDKAPEMIYINGLARTMGCFGSKAECAMMGDSFIIDGTTAASLTETRLTIIIQYPKKTYHYVVECETWQPKTRPNTRVLDAQLLSEFTK
jgi:hypothetical protein